MAMPSQEGLALHLLPILTSTFFHLPTLPHSPICLPSSLYAAPTHPLFCRYHQTATPRTAGIVFTLRLRCVALHAALHTLSAISLMPRHGSPATLFACACLIPPLRHACRYICSLCHTFTLCCRGLQFLATRLPYLHDVITPTTRSATAAAWGSTC